METQPHTPTPDARTYRAVCSVVQIVRQVATHATIVLEALVEGREQAHEEAGALCLASRGSALAPSVIRLPANSTQPPHPQLVRGRVTRGRDSATTPTHRKNAKPAIANQYSHTMNSSAVRIRFLRGRHTDRSTMMSSSYLRTSARPRECKRQRCVLWLGGRTVLRGRSGRTRRRRGAAPIPRYTRPGTPCERTINGPRKHHTRHVSHPLRRRATSVCHKTTYMLYSVRGARSKYHVHSMARPTAHRPRHIVAMDSRRGPDDLDS